MKNALRIAIVLTWFNLVLWGLIVVMMTLSVIATHDISRLVVVILLSAIPLNCYAALQLQRSIRRPVLRLSSQTPTGIRLVGFVALFFAISFILNGFAFLGSTPKAVDLLKEAMNGQIRSEDMALVTISNVRSVAIVAIFLALCVGVNVILNFRLLRWYYLVRQSDIKQSDVS